MTLSLSLSPSPSCLSYSVYTIWSHYKLDFYHKKWKMRSFTYNYHIDTAEWDEKGGGGDGRRERREKLGLGNMIGTFQPCWVLSQNQDLFLYILVKLINETYFSLHLNFLLIECKIVLNYTSHFVQDISTWVNVIMHLLKQ